MTETTDTTDESDETNSATLKRREVIGTLAAAGVLGSTAIAQTDSGGSNGSVGVGGGPMSDEMADTIIRWYERAESELPDAGVQGRYARITQAGSNFEVGDIVKDDGSSWGKIDIGVGSLDAEHTHYDGNPDAIIYARDGTYYADGVGGVIDSGPEAHTVINSAIGTRSAGPKRRQHIQLVGDFAMVGDIAMESHTVLDLSSAYLKVDPDHPGGDLIDGTGGIQNSVIYGGYIDGNAANVTSNVSAIAINSSSESTAFAPGGHNIIAHTRINSMTGATAITDNSRRDVLIDVRVENSQTHGIRLAGTDIAAIFCLSRGAGIDGWQIARPHVHLYKCIGAMCGRYGVFLQGTSTNDANHTYIMGGFYENNQNEGFYLNSVSKCLISPFEVIGNGQATDGNQAAILAESASRNWFADIDIHDPKDTTTQQEAILLDSNSTENIIRDVQHDQNPQGIVDNGARNVRDGRSYQSAVPGSATTGDDWGGNEALAAKWNVTVVDESSTQPYSMYKADGAGQWSQIS